MNDQTTQELIYHPLSKTRSRPTGNRNSQKVKDHKLTVGYTYFKEKAVPMIRLSGDWLKRQGFSLGKKVIVQEQPGELVIQLVEEA